MHVPTLTNPRNNLEKSMFQFWQIHAITLRNPCTTLTNLTISTRRLTQWQGKVMIGLGSDKKTPSSLYPSSSTQAGAPLPSRASRGQWGQEETKRSLPHDRGGDQDRRQGLQQPVLVPGTPEDSSQEQKRGSRGERRPRRRSRKREPVVMGHNTGHSIQ